MVLQIGDCAQNFMEMSPMGPFSRTQTDDALKTKELDNVSKLPDSLYVPSHTELDGSLGHLV